MKIFESLNEITNIECTTIALGNFDGVHKGHQKLIETAVEKAKEYGHKSAVFTFSNHPKNVTAGRSIIKNILYQEDKEKLLRGFGIDYLFCVPFDKSMMELTPEAFIKDLLVEKFRMKEAYCGFNYHFGYRAQGSAKLLKSMQEELGYVTNIMDPVFIDGNLVSSTFIRDLIASGKVDQCPKYMGRNYAVGGTVVVGNKIGRTIGFPTSNITIDESMVTPENGVYITNCIYNGIQYAGVTNVGEKPTIGNYHKNVETNIFHFNKDIYGKKIRVEFLKRIRPEYKFESVEALTRQIQKDSETARAYHGI